KLAQSFRRVNRDRAREMAFFPRRFRLYFKTMSAAAKVAKLRGAVSPGARAGAVFFLFLLVACSVPPSRVRVAAPPEARLSQVGIASWYGPGFHGKPTTSGAIYNQYEFTAAHQTLPLGTRVMVTNMENGRATEVTINDRGPFAKNRIIDLSYSPAPLQAIRASLDYTLQLGSFAQLDNARQLRDRAAASFTDVSIAPLKAKDATYYRVQLGSFSSRADAEARAREVAQAGYSVIILEK